MTEVMWPDFRKSDLVDGDRGLSAARAPLRPHLRAGAGRHQGIGIVKRVAILGSTGSVGEQTLEVIAAFPDRFAVAVARGRPPDRQARRTGAPFPSCAGVGRGAGRPHSNCKDALGADAPEIAVGDAGLLAVATADADLVVSALVGAVGLAPTLAAIRAGRDVALANKEVMVMAGALVLREVQARGVRLLPVDSEHSAIFQVLAGQRPEDLLRILLTASGGPFRTWTAERIARATIEEALAHPNWSMGPKITIDSATLMNKGLEVIEARWLFDTAARAHRCRRASAVDRALADRALRRLGARAARRARHARADRGGDRLARAPAAARRREHARARAAAARSRDREPARLRGAGSQALPVPRSRLRGAARRRGRARRAERGQRGRRWRRSSRARSRSGRSRRPTPRCSRQHLRARRRQRVARSRRRPRRRRAGARARARSRSRREWLDERARPSSSRSC